MNWKKFGKIALMVLTVAFIAQAGMRLWWPQPEAAKANTVYNVFCWWQNGESEVPIAEDEIHVMFRFDSDSDMDFDDEDWEEPTSQGLGVFSYDRAGNFVGWQVKYTNEGETEYWGVNPSANLNAATGGGTTSYLDWQFAFIM